MKASHKLELLVQLYNAAKLNRSEDVLNICDILIRNNVSNSLQNQVKKLAHASNCIEDIVVTVQGLICEDDLTAVRIPALNF